MGRLKGIREYIGVLSFLIAVIICNVATPLALADALPQQWLKQYGGSSYTSNGMERIAKDESGNIFVTDVLTESTTGQYTVATVKYDRNGNEVWSQKNGSYSSLTPTEGITTGPNDSVYVSYDLDDKYVTVKYNSDGSKAWERQFSGVRGRVFFGATPNTLLTDSSGDVYIAGGKANYNGTTLIKYDASGTLLWSQSYDYDGGVAIAIASDSAGNIYLTGQGSTDTGGNVLTMKYTANGVQSWVKVYDVKNYDVPTNIAVDANQNAYVTGYTQSSADNNDQNFLTIKYDQNGGQTWVREYDPGPAGQGNELLFDTDNNVYLAGTIANGGWKAVLIKYNPSGDEVWVQINSYIGQAQGTVLQQEGEEILMAGLGYSGDTSYDYFASVYDMNGDLLKEASLNLGGVEFLRDAVIDDGNIYGVGNACDSNWQQCRLTTVKFGGGDITPPVVMGVADRSANANGWYNSDVTINWNATDQESTPTTPSPTTASTEGQNVSYTSQPSCDASNNCATGSLQVSLDKTLPTVSNLTWSTNPLLLGQSTTLSVSAQDGLSGVDAVEYSLDGGVPLPMAFDNTSGTWQATFGSNLAVSTYNVAITATDKASNVSQELNDVLAVYSTNNGYITGHTKSLPTALDVLPIVRDTSNNPAKLIVGFTNLTAPTSGSFDLSYVIKNNKDAFSVSSTAVNWVVVQDANHASILGHGDLTTYVNGVKVVTTNVAVRFDIVLGANGSSDQISVKIFNPGLNPNTDSPTYTVSNQVIANGSSLMIHP
jgi:hypothetical protein